MENLTPYERVDAGRLQVVKDRLTERQTAELIKAGEDSWCFGAVCTDSLSATEYKPVFTLADMVGMMTNTAMAVDEHGRRQKLTLSYEGYEWRGGYGGKIQARGKELIDVLHRLKLILLKK